MLVGAGLGFVAGRAAWQAGEDGAFSMGVGLAAFAVWALLTKGGPLRAAGIRAAAITIIIVRFVVLVVFLLILLTLAAVSLPRLFS
ncbi:MAG: hypothetical protein AB1635_14035 [Acidobacteriota bacterium]